MSAPAAPYIRPAIGPSRTTRPVIEIASGRTERIPEKRKAPRV